MVDVTDKPATDRVAVAKGRVTMQPATLEMIIAGNAAKGDVLGTAPPRRRHGRQKDA